MKKAIWILMTGLLLLLLLQTAVAETICEGSCGEGVSYILDSNGILTISGDGAITEYPWTADQYKKIIKTVDIQNGVTSIGHNSFFGCINLTDVTIPESVLNIGEGAFSGCSSLTEVTIPDGVTVLSSWVFDDCFGLTNVHLPDSITTISSYAFEECKQLKSIVLPDNIEKVGAVAFGVHCKIRYANPESVTAVTLSKAGYSFRIPGMNYNQLFIYGDDGIDGIEISNVDRDVEEFVFPEDVLRIGQATFEYCKELTELVIPDSVTSIGEWAFDSSGIIRIEIPESVQSIGNYAFFDCQSLKSIRIPEGIQAIGSDMFHNCTTMTHVYLPDSVTSIGYQAFAYCSMLTDIVLPKNLTVIEEYAFRNCKSLVSINIPDGVTSISKDAFCMCSSLRDVRIPDGVTSIGMAAFFNCSNLRDVHIPDGVTSIGYAAFHECKSIKSINIPKGVSSIESNTFYNCSELSNVTLEEGLKSIGGLAFSGCSSLTYITIPRSVTSLHPSFISSCENLKGILFLHSPEDTISLSTIFPLEIDAAVTIYCYKDSDVDAYFTGRENPVVYLDTLDPETIRTISLEDDFFLEIGKTRSVSCMLFPSYDQPNIEWSSSQPKIASVDGGAVTAHLPGTTVITASVGSATDTVAVTVQIPQDGDILLLPDDTTEIESEAFAGTGFTIAIIPEGCKAIGQRAFAECGRLEHVIILSKSITVADNAFENCSEDLVIDRVD